MQGMSNPATQLPFASAKQQLHEALRTHGVAVIQAPPGTGKTTTLVQSIIQTLKNEPQVLVCAPGNVAVDLLVEKLAVQGVDVVRVGHPARVTPQVLEHTLDARVANHIVLGRMLIRALNSKK